MSKRSKGKIRILVFMSRECPHCRELLTSELFRRWLRAVSALIEVHDIATDTGIILASNYLGLAPEEHHMWASGGFRLLKTPTIVVEKDDEVVSYTGAPTDPFQLWLFLSEIVGLAPLPYEEAKKKKKTK